MANVSLSLKREAVAQGYSFWVKSVTGTPASLVRRPNGIEVRLSESQINAMSANVLESMNAKPSPEDLNVSMPWGDIMAPVVFKKYWPYMTGGVLALVGVGFLLGRR